jgi:peptidoglycan hydrolase-like protein with peptidoglycan-binding domain
MVGQITTNNTAPLWRRNKRLHQNIVLALALLLPLSAPALAIAQTAPNAAPAEASSDNSRRPVLRLGSEGQDVADVQAMLTLLGFYRGPIDGRFGDTTTIAVATFQQAAGITVDGIVGNRTWSRLLPSLDAINRLTARQANPSATEASSQETAIAPSQSANPTPTRTTTSNTEAAPPASATPRRSSEATVPYVEFPVLRRGMRGAAVIGLQSRLQALGLYIGPTDGIFGGQTEEAVIAAQQRFNLLPDGIVGAATWTALTQPEGRN